VELIDFGQNTSFMPRIRVSGPAGSTIKLTAGEVVNEDGTINRSTMGGAHRGSAWWQYTKASDRSEEWFPQFYYVGSRYLHVELLPAAEGGERPELDEVEMVVVHSTAAPAGDFRTSDARLNRIRDLVRWAQRSNMVSLLTDCPHREKLGWLEQVHLNGPALRYEWDVTRLMAKMERDMADAQTPDGLIPNIAPEYTEFKGTFRAAAEWGASFIMVPWQQYRHTGDTELMREQYERMKRYLAYLESRAAGGLLEEGLGDWYDQVLGKPGRANLTPARITATAHLFQNAKVLAQMARVLGHDSDAAGFEAGAEKIRETFNRELFKPDTPELYGTGSQTSFALPLAMAMAPPAERDRVFRRLVDDIEQRGHATSGAVGYRYLLHALTDGGRSDLIHRLITNEEMPGYAYQLKQGATALAESWTAQLGASQNHFFLGQIIEWFYGDLAGLRSDPSVPGFKRTVIKPHPVEELEWVEASHDSLHGRHLVRWQQEERGFTLSVSVPANTTAEVQVPAADARQVKVPDGARFLRVDDGRAIFEIESGDYEFVVQR
jgi:alpha-L-rhamnosidase